MQRAQVRSLVRELDPTSHDIHMLQLKILNAARKTWHGQINKISTFFFKKDETYETKVFKTLDIKQQRQWSLRDEKQTRWALWLPQNTLFRKCTSAQQGKPGKTEQTPWVEEANLRVHRDQSGYNSHHREPVRREVHRELQTPQRVPFKNLTRTDKCSAYVWKNYPSRLENHVMHKSLSTH